MKTESYQAKHPAAFINVIAESGTKAEAIRWLQQTWDELVDANTELTALKAQLEQTRNPYED